MTGEGTVVKTSGTHATVCIEKKSACSGECSSCGMCKNPVYDVEAENTVGAQPGDRVMLYMPSGKVYKAAFLVYMLPILAVLAVLGVCNLLGFHSGVTALICIAALGVWILIIRRYNKKADLNSRIIEIIK